MKNKKAKSDIWQHFCLKLNTKSNQLVDNVAICFHCNLELKRSGGGTSNLKTHIDSRYPTIISDIHSVKYRETVLPYHDIFHNTLKAYGDSTNLFCQVI